MRKYFVTLFCLLPSLAEAEYVRGHYRNGRYVESYTRSKGRWGGKYNSGKSNHFYDQQNNKQCLKTINEELSSKTVKLFNASPYNFKSWTKDGNQLHINFTDKSSFFFGVSLNYEAKLQCIEATTVVINDIGLAKRYLSNSEWSCCLIEEYYKTNITN